MSRKRLGVRAPVTSVPTQIKLSHLYPALEDLSYPLSHDAAVHETADVTLRLADGTIPLSSVIEDAETDEYHSQEDLLLDVMALLPRRAVGDPYQAEGEG